MRHIKKISAIILIVAMLFSMMSISAFATDPDTKFTVKYGNSVGSATVIKTTNLTSLAFDIYYSAYNGSDVEGCGASIKISYKDYKEAVDSVNVALNSTDYKDLLEQGDPTQGLTGVYFTTGTVAGKQMFKADKKLATITFNFKADKLAALDKFELKLNAVSGKGDKPSAKINVDGTNVPFTVNFSDAVKVTELASPINVTDKAYGTALTSVLPSTVEVKTVKQVGGAAGANQTLAVAWDGYDPYAIGAQEVVGTLTSTDPEGISVTDVNTAKSIKATVTLQPIAYTATAPVATAKVMAFKEDKADDADGSKAVKAALANKNKIALTVKDGATEEEKITDEITVNWNDATVAWSGNIKTVGSTATVTYTFTAADGILSTNKYYKAAKDTTVTATVTVVPANIEGGSFELTDSTFVPNTKPSVKVTIPASVVADMPVPAESDNPEVKAKYTVTISVPSKTEGTAAPEIKSVELDKTVIQAAKDAVAAAAGDPEKLAKIEPITTTITLDKTLSDLGYDYSKDDKKAFTVSVTVGGTTLLTKDGKGSVDGTVVKPSSGGSSGSIGINKGNTTKTYAVTVVETKNGTATVSADKAAQGTTVTVKAEPAEGYKVKTVTVTKADGTNVPVDEKAYTFTMPASAVKVTVEFEEGKDEPSVDPTPAEDKFADVADDFWAAKDIYTLKDAGIIGGKSATEFDPEGDVTRAEFAKMVVGLFGYKATSDAVNFEDCKAEDWFTPYVAAGVEAGVIKGVSDTEFAPNATITREDACTILGRALNKVAQSNELKFTDADKVAEYAAPYVALLSELGYVNGYEDGSFAPTNNITRAEAAKIIAGIYNANKSAETVTDDKTETDANADAAVDEKVEEKTDEKAVDTIETEPEK